ncbi:Uncharacterized protein FKW44_013952 [Caligus rogercresseyi]|uniref:Uncharacterized protein n=1 Tax=Caligus rogercresseyi TaxID=217165 RepID=A0A7T8GYI1_CALRO|nr:Uncharacterized protein FKW44_013952 [Caligus rogercresseyi]
MASCDDHAGIILTYSATSVENTAVRGQEEHHRICEVCLQAYFKVKLGNQDKSWAPYTVCKTCVEYLRRSGFRWYGESRLTMQRIVTSAPSILLASTGRIGKASSTTDLPSARRPVAHCEDIPVPAFTQLPDSDDEATITDEREIQKSSSMKHKMFNDLVRDLSLWKISSELLASRLKEKNLLGKDVRIIFFRRRHEDYMGYFCQEEDLVYCRDVAVFLLNSALLNTIRETGDSSLKQAFFEVFRLNPSCALNNSQKKYEALKYHHKWIICVDLKMVNFLLGQQYGFTNPALCKERVAGARSVKDIDPPLHLKLGLMKQFTRALDKDVRCFNYLCRAFPRLTSEKVKAACRWPTDTEAYKGPRFQNSMNTLECAAKPRRLISTMIEAFQKLEFTENLGAMSDEQGERFIRTAPNGGEMGDYCWSLKRDNTAAAHTGIEETPIYA